MTPTVTTTDLTRKPAEVFAMAHRQPVTLTQHNAPRFVLMSIEDYEAFRALDKRKAYSINQMTPEHEAFLQGALSDLKKETDDTNRP
jgi:prevent-host-death family protein